MTRNPESSAPSRSTRLRRFSVILLAIAVVVGWQASPRVSESDTGSGPTVYTGPIIDMHVRAFSAAAESFFGVEHPPTLRGETYPGVATPEEQRDKTLERLRAHNVVKAVVSGGELWLDQAPDMILVGGGLEPIEQLREQFDAGQLQVIGELAPFYRGLLADDPAVEPYFALADELGIPVGFHILAGGPNGGLYLEQLVQAGFGNRIMFGSDQMTWPQTIDIAVGTVNSAPFLSMEQKADIFYDNAAAFLELDPQEIEAHKAGS